MPEPISLILFIIAAVVLAFSPRPSILYVMARTVAGGRVDGIASTLGAATGGLVHVAISAIGLSALLLASAEAFTLIKYLGAAYLVYLGVRTLQQAKFSMRQLPVQASGGRRVFLEGAFTEIFNVKTALFFLAFIPQFVDQNAALMPQFLLLGLICVLFNMLADFTVVFGTTRLLPFLDNSPRAARNMNRGAGGIMIGLGAFVAFDQAR